MAAKFYETSNLHEANVFKVPSFVCVLVYRERAFTLFPEIS